MSLDQRCQQFHDAALGTGKSKGPVKEIATLRKFLHKNQHQRFTDKAVGRLFDTIQIYCSQTQVETDALLEDALKMPFTVFSTKQKKTMIKWLEDRRGGGSATTIVTLSLIDILEDEDNRVSLMSDETGDTYEDLRLPGDQLGASIRQKYETTESVVSLEVELVDSKLTRIIGIAEE